MMGYKPTARDQLGWVWAWFMLTVLAGVLGLKVHLDSGTPWGWFGFGPIIILGVATTIDELLELLKLRKNEKR